MGDGSGAQRQGGGYVGKGAGVQERQLRGSGIPTLHHTLLWKFPLPACAPSRASGSYREATAPHFHSRLPLALISLRDLEASDVRLHSECRVSHTSSHFLLCRDLEASAARLRAVRQTHGNNLRNLQKVVADTGAKVDEAKVWGRCEGGGWPSLNPKTQDLTCSFT